MNLPNPLILTLATFIASTSILFADYPAEVLADTPVAYWRLDDADGTTIADSSGNGHDGAVDGVAGSITFGESGLLPTEAGNGSITLAGLDRIVVPGFDKIGAGGFTAEYWIKLDQLPAGFLNLVGDGAGGGAFFMMNYTNVSGIIRPHFGTANTPVSVDSPAGTLVVNTTYHIVTSWDPTDPNNNNGKIYLNGVLLTQTGVTANFDAANEIHPLFIGRDDRENRAANFKIDEVALYDFALSATRVAEHYAAGTGGAVLPTNYPEDVLSDSPTAYWRLGDAAGPTAADSSGNGHDATADPGISFGQASLIPPDPDTAVGVSGTDGVTSPTFGKSSTGTSIEFFMKRNAEQIGDFANAVGDSETAGDFHLKVEANGVGDIRATVQTDSGTASATSPSPLDDDPHQVAATWDAASGDLLLYIDGIQAASGNRTGNAINTDNPISIGGGGLDLCVDEVAVYDFPLTADRVASHFGWFIPPPPPTVNFGVEVASSTLIGALHYSDSFTITSEGGIAGRPGAGAFPVGLPGINLEGVHGNTARSWTDARWSIAEDGTVNDPATVYNGSGAGSATGMTQTGGGVDYGLAYGISDHFIVQFDSVQVPDRVNITASDTLDSIAGGLAVFFRTSGTGNPEIGLYNGSAEIDSGLSSGIAFKNEWHNYAVRFDIPNSLIEVYVDEVSLGVVDLAALNGGSHNTASNGFVNVGNTATDGARAWTDNVQIGAPGSAARFEITEFFYDIVGNTAELTWNSTPGQDYKIFASLDLETWFELMDASGAAGAQTGVEIDLAFFFGASVPSSLYFRVQN
jgi:hypothetical protein